jgi:hypothetical protein
MTGKGVPPPAERCLGARSPGSSPPQRRARDAHRGEARKLRLRTAHGTGRPWGDSHPLRNCHPRRSRSETTARLTCSDRAHSEDLSLCPGTKTSIDELRWAGGAPHGRRCASSCIEKWGVRASRSTVVEPVGARVPSREACDALPDRDRRGHLALAPSDDRSVSWVPQSNP